MADFTVEFLGTGTSTGVPMIGCKCAVCTSLDPRDKRLRPSVLIRTDRGNLLVDTGPDMRTQLLRADVDRVEAVLFTHDHADHLMGLDDIRQINHLQNMVMPLYGNAPTLQSIRRVFDYCFKETQKGGGKPQLELHALQPFEPISLLGLEILPLWHYHGRMPVLSFLIDKRFAYVTDVSAIPWLTWKALRGVDTLVLGAVRHEPHSTHLSVGQAVAVGRALGVPRTLLTHLSHHLGHAETQSGLPGVEVAYDGLTVSVSVFELGAHHFEVLLTVLIGHRIDGLSVGGRQSVPFGLPAFYQRLDSILGVGGVDSGGYIPLHRLLRLFGRCDRLFVGRLHAGTDSDGENDQERCNAGDRRTVGGERRTKSGG